MSNLELTIRLKAALGDTRKKFEEVTNAGSHLTRQLRETQAESKKLATAQKNFDKFAESRRKLQQLGSELGDTQNAIRQLTQEISRSGVPTREQAQRLQELQRRGRELSQQQQQTRLSSENLRRSLTEAGISTRNLGQAQSELRRRQEQANQTIEEQRRRLERLNQAQSRYNNAQSRASSLKSAAGSAAIKGAATMTALSFPVREYAAAEKASTDLKVSMMQADGSYGKFKEMDAEATRLGAYLPGNKANFANMFRDLKMQGLSDNTILGGGGTATAYLNVVMGNELEDGAFFAKMMEAHGIDSNDNKALLKSADLTQRASFAAGLSGEDMLQAMSYYAPKVNTLGLTGTENQKQILTIEGLSANKGLEGSNFGTNFSMLLSQLSKGPKMVAEAKKGAKAEVREMIESSGASFDFFNKDGSIKSLREITGEMESGFNKIRSKYGEKGVMDAADALFGQEGGRVAAIMGQAGLKEFDAFAAKMDAQASLQQRVEAQLGTLSSLWDAAGGSFSNFMVAMGDSISPELKATTKWIAEITDKMGAWATRNPQLAAAIMKTIAAIGLLFLAFAGIAAVVATVLGPFAFMRLALVQVGPLFAGAGGAIAKLLPMLNWLKMGLLMVGRAFLANPIILVVAAIAAGLYLLWKHWDTVKAALITGWNWIQQTFADNPILNFLFPIIGAARLIVNNWGVIAPFFQNLWTSISGYVVEKAAFIFGYLAMSWLSIKAIASSTWNNIKNIVVNAWNSLINWVRSTSVYQAIANQWDKITSYLGGLKDTLFNLGAKIIGGLIDGIASKFAVLKSKWNTVASVFNGSYKGTATVNAGASIGASLPGFSTGGYTGNGGRNAIAGIVHRGEGVLNQSDIRAIGGESGFNRLRGLIRTWGSRGIEMLANGGLGQVKTGGLINRSLALLDNGQKQERPKFRDAISVNAAMATAGGTAPAATSTGDFNVTIHITGGNDNAETIAAAVERKFREMKAGFDRQNKTSLWDRD